MRIRMQPLLPVRLVRLRTLPLLLAALLPAACAVQLDRAAPLAPQSVEARCLLDCRAARAACDSDARQGWRGCQADYAARFSDYRWCLASATERAECGYPWWSCAENAYRDCRQRHQACDRACNVSPAVPWNPPGTEG